jgi:hypothetical protein
MSPNLVLITLIAAPVALLMILRINAALVFLSACLGSVLLQFIAQDASDFTSGAGMQLGSETVKLVLLLVPVVLTTVFMVRTIRGGGRLMLNVLPALGVGLLLSLLIVPLLPKNLAQDILTAPLWSEVENAQDLIVGISAMVCLLFLWMMRPKAGEKHGKRHK